MGLFDGGKQKTTTKVDMNPWSGAQDNLGYGMDQARSIYDNFSPTAFGSMVTPFNAWQNAALGGIANRAMTGNPLEGQAQGVAANQMANPQSPAMGWLGGQMLNPNSGANVAMPAAWNDINAAQGYNPATGYMNAATQGGFLNSNPRLDDMFNAQTDAMTRQYREATAPTTGAGFSGSGRLRGGDAEGGGYNSAVARNESELMDGLARAGANTYGNAYNMERGLQQNAATTMGNQWLSQLGLGQNATSNLANIGAQGQQGQLNAANMFGNQFFQGQQGQLNAANAGMNFANRDYENLDRLYAAGQTQQAQGDRTLADQARLHDFYQTGAGNPWAQFGNLWNPAVQAGQLGQQGTTRQTSQYKPGGLDYLSLGANAIGAGLNFASGGGLGAVQGLFGSGGTPMAGGYTGSELKNLAGVM